MASRNFGNDFSDRPAWAYAMGDTGATAAMGQLATAPNSGVQNQAYSLPATLPEQLDPVNQAVVAELEKEMRTGCQSKELCFDSVLRLYQWAGATPKFRVQALNTKIDLYNEKIKELKNRNPHMSPRPLKDELTDGEKDLFDKKLRYGLFAGDDNFLRLLVERLQSGDIVHFPGYTLLIKKKHQPPQPVDFAGHVGILLFNPKKNQWEVVSTHNEKNGKVIPGWQVEPLEDFSFRYFCRSNQLPEFYHWIGPDPLPRR
ncbi:hypothetical protein MAMC_01005 [Methylacidimicrobium cyclopophantes]|uniref:Uncharacterized protein n=1 Tax=Methylacidimicrobium cyclopophantes TaxID=1041766 RepID=A0A5E6MJJ2_9BACT|nr:hypothetical protein [Methylacidimicrobium cyclopophantes]VVM06237.1 hypothetical protein MAMC_01005 [Methylacidimicrobium cyclopophantes]